MYHADHIIGLWNIKTVFKGIEIPKEERRHLPTMQLIEV